MFKKIIAPVQAWLLSQNKCVGCGTSLENSKREKGKEGYEKVFCQCGRIFIYETKNKKYRRALFEEV